MNNLLKIEIDKFDDYAGLISALIQLDVVLDIVCMQNNTSCLRSETVALPTEWQVLNADTETAINSKQETLIRTPLKLGAEENPFWLVLILPDNQSLNDGKTMRLQKVLQHTADLVREDYNLDVTLNGMAHELAIRYEELNVVYGIDNLIQYKNDNSFNEENALETLAKSCLDYLPVDFIAITVSSEQLSIKYIDKDRVLNSIDPFINQRLDEMFIKVKDIGETLVINRNDVTDWTDGKLMMPFKLIISPIFSMNNTVTGILVFANNLDKPDFTNSDRKLSDVIATEAANILINKRDNLTGLFNRKSFDQQITKVIDEVKQEAALYCLIYIDIDQFKIVNETAGNDAGDKLLKQVSSLLKTNFDKTILVYRTGSDEFSLLLKDIPLEETVTIAKDIQRKISSVQFHYDNHVFDINLSIGLLELESDMTDPSTVLSTLQMTCESAKEQGGDRVRIYHPDAHDFKQQRILIQSASLVKEALRNNRFILYGQEIYASNNKEVNSHYEVLIRMLDDNDNIIPPGLFIPAAEEYKMMLQLDQWVLNNALQTLYSWIQNNKNKKLVLSINISGQSISDDRFAQNVVKTILASKISPKRLCFEITETAAVANLPQALNFIDVMRELGCTFALDDFGSGMSSFNYLKNLPIDYLKIDGCFVKNMLEHSIDHAMVDSINNIGHVMGLKTIAEFVENEEIKDELTRIQVDYLQGYGVHKPEPLTDILQLDTAMPLIKQQRA